MILLLNTTPLFSHEFPVDEVPLWPLPFQPLSWNCPLSPQLSLVWRSRSGRGWDWDSGACDWLRGTFREKRVWKQDRSGTGAEQRVWCGVQHQHDPMGALQCPAHRSLAPPSGKGAGQSCMSSPGPWGQSSGENGSCEPFPVDLDSQRRVQDHWWGSIRGINSGHFKDCIAQERKESKDKSFERSFAHIAQVQRHLVKIAQPCYHFIM